jgi:hypothetical protein
MDFYVCLECAARLRTNVQLLQPNELLATLPDQRVRARNPFALRVTLSRRGVVDEIGVVPPWAISF